MLYVFVLHTSLQKKNNFLFRIVFFNEKCVSPEQNADQKYCPKRFYEINLNPNNAALLTNIFNV